MFFSGAHISQRTLSETSSPIQSPRQSKQRVRVFYYMEIILTEVDLCLFTLITVKKL